MAENKDVKIYKCTNFGACAKADSGEDIKIPTIETLGGTPPCPCCHQNTLEEQISKGPNKKLIAAIVGAVVGCAAIGGGIYAITDPPLEPPTISLIHSEKTLKVGEVDTLKATVSPESTQATIVWKASKDGTVEVQDGIVKAVKGGSGKVRVQAIVGKDTLSAICKYTVSGGDYSLSLNHTEKTLKVGQTDKLVATLEPANAKVQYTWTVNGNDCIEVNDGTVKANKAGTGEVQVIATIDNINISATCKYTIEGGTPPPPPPLSYGRYSGDRNAQGQPHGFGDIVFTKSKLVTGNTYAEPGYKIRNGRFVNGKLQSGTLYDADGNKVCFVDANNNL